MGPMTSTARQEEHAGGSAGSLHSQGAASRDPVRASLGEAERRRLFAEQVAPMIDRLWGNALRYTRDRHDADDLVQETLLKAFRKFHQFEQGSSLTSWVFRIMHTTHINRYRSRRRGFDEVPEEPTGEYSLYDLVAEIDAPTERLALDGVGAPEVRRALAELPDASRIAIYLRDVEGFTYREIAEITDASVATIGSRLTRGRRRLGETLLGYARERRLIREPSQPSGLQA